MESAALWREKKEGIILLFFIIICFILQLWLVIIDLVCLAGSPWYNHVCLVGIVYF